MNNINYCSLWLPLGSCMYINNSIELVHYVDTVHVRCYTCLYLLTVHCMFFIHCCVCSFWSWQSTTAYNECTAQTTPQNIILFHARIKSFAINTISSVFVCCTIKPCITYSFIEHYNIILRMGVIKAHEPQHGYMYIDKVMKQL